MGCRCWLYGIETDEIVDPAKAHTNYRPMARPKFEERVACLRAIPKHFGAAKVAASTGSGLIPRPRTRRSTGLTSESNGSEMGY